KRKLMQSLMAGTPAVSTPVGVEGFELEHDHHVLVADNSAAFAAAIVRLIEDESLWTRMAREGRARTTKVYSRKAVFAQFISVLSDITSSPASSSIFCEELRPESQSKFESGVDAEARQEIRKSGRLNGFCNVFGVESEFTVSSDDLREDVVSTASASIN